MATEQKFDNGVMLSYQDAETGGSVVFALYDHGQWSRWHDDELSRGGLMELAVPVCPPRWVMPVKGQRRLLALGTEHRAATTE